MKTLFRQSVLKASAAVALGLVTAFTYAAPANVLWFDNTPEYGGQSTNVMRQAFSNSLNSYNGGATFSSTYVDGFSTNLATALAAKPYDVVFIDDTGGNGYSNADKTALQNFYSGHKNLLMDGSIYVRNINYAGLSALAYPGPGGAMSGFTINEANALASRGGGIFFGTDHNCCQSSINGLIGSILPGAAFSGIAAPNTSGLFYGNDLLNGLVPIAANDVLTHWSAEGSQGIPPKGSFVDYLGGAVELSVLADFPSGGIRQQFVTASWAVGSGSTAANNTTAGGTAGGNTGSTTGTVPVPGSALLVMLGLAGFGFVRRKLSI